MREYAPAGVSSRGNARRLWTTKASHRSSGTLPNIKSLTFLDIDEERTLPGRDWRCNELAATRVALYEGRMLEGARIAVVVPAYNEERLIAKTLATIPSFVDAIVVVDDASHDETAEVARSHGSPRVRVIRHATNRGVGASIVTGYRASLRAGADVIAVMAGDAQMHPDDLRALSLAVSRGETDYAKGDRMSHPEARRIMPAARFWVGRVLSFLTRRATGLATFSDSQCGYTAISARAIALLDLDDLFPRYGYPNDLVGQLVLSGQRIRDVPVRPVYGDEASGVRFWHVAVILGLIVRIAYRRLSRRSEVAPAPAADEG